MNPETKSSSSESSSSPLKAIVVGRSFSMIDLVILAIYVSMLLWFSQKMVTARTPSLAELPIRQQALQSLLVMIGIGSVSTLPLLWVLYTLNVNSKIPDRGRQSLIPPLATLLAINYGTIAVGNPITTMGVATATLGLGMVATYYLNQTIRTRWVLIGQSFVYGIAGLTC